jgi:hypothetical protein
MTELAQFLAAIYKDKEAAPKTLILQALSQIFTSYGKVFMILGPNVFLLHVCVKQS